MKPFLLPLLLLVACAQAQTLPTPTAFPSPLAPVVDVDKLLPQPAHVTAPPPALAARFEDTPLGGGQYCEGKDCRPLPAGVLVDEVSYTLAITNAATMRRLQAEVNVLRDLRTKERAAAEELEQAYRAQLVQANANTQAVAAERDSMARWRPWVFAAGWVLGAAVTGFVVASVK